MLFKSRIDCQSLAVSSINLVELSLTWLVEVFWCYGYGVGHPGYGQGVSVGGGGGGVSVGGTGVTVGGG